MDKVRFGIVGTGSMGSGHARTIQGIEEAQLTAVCDIDEKAVKSVAAEHNVEAFTSHEELLDSGLVDAIIIATPHYFHPPIAIDAMKRGIHVLSEKPVSVTVSAADEMNRVARRMGKSKGVKFAVMYQQRSLPVYRAAKKLVEEGRLGKIYRTCFIEPNFRSQAYYRTAGWRATWKGEGGGVLINQAPHGIDLFTWIGGLPSRVTAVTRTWRHKIEVEDEASAMLEYKGGAIGYYHTSVNEFPTGSYMEFCGETGKIVIYGGELKFWSLDTPIQKFTNTTKEMWGRPDAREEEVELEERETGHGAIIRNLARSILYGEELIAPGIEGIKSVEFINAVILSGKKGKPVDIPVDREEYDRLIRKLQKTSKVKDVKRVARRETDPSYRK
ncbi:MAG: Gfo/Idh/MocA family protein [bacterium]